MLDKGKHQRLQRALRPHLARGWERAVFAAPQSGDDANARAERVLPGPGADVAPTSEQVEALLAAAADAADAGLFKQTVVLDPRRRVQVDARHGRASVRTLDEGTALKMMGGKPRALRPDTSAALLREIGIMNADGSISATHARKYKQICHLATLCEPVIERLASTRAIDASAPLRALDLACGNAYLSFVLAEVLRLRGVPLRLHGVDVRADLVARSQARARALGLAAPDDADASADTAIASARSASREAGGAKRAGEVAARARAGSASPGTGAPTGAGEVAASAGAESPSPEAGAPTGAGEVAVSAGAESPSPEAGAPTGAGEVASAGAESPSPETGAPTGPGEVAVSARAESPSPEADAPTGAADEARSSGHAGEARRVADAAALPRATGLSFAQADIAGAARTAAARLGGVPDLVLALHACDTATDEAIALAIALGVPALLSVPCCQAELAAQLSRADADAHPLAAMVEHGLLRRAYADVLTDSLRVAALEACGYDVTVLEFVGGEHTPKNLLIKAHRRHARASVDPRRWRLEPLQARCAALGVKSDLLRRLTAIQASSSPREI